MVLPRDRGYFAILFLCVPIQYLVIQYTGSTETSRNYEIYRLINELQKIPAKWLRLEPWKNWCRSILVKIIEGSLLSSLPAEVDYGESPAFEVLKFREKEGYFGMSSEIRDVKPPSVILRVGQVVRHRHNKFRGVIVGWDETARAPKEWITKYHQENTDWSQQPNYAVLIDTRDRPVPQFAYIPQENLVPEKNTRIVHPKVEDYFEHFDGSHYIPRPWLKGLYPKD